MQYSGALGFLVILIALLASCKQQSEQDMSPSPIEPNIPYAASDTSVLSAPMDSATNTIPSASENKLREDKSYIFLQRDTDATDDGVQLLLDVMEAEGLHFYQTQAHPAGLIGSNDVVLLKINCQWAERGGTNTDLIRAVAEAVAECLRPIQEKYNDLISNKDYLEKIYTEGAQKAEFIANKTLKKVYKKVGFII